MIQRKWKEKNIIKQCTKTGITDLLRAVRFCKGTKLIAFHVLKQSDHGLQMWNAAKCCRRSRKAGEKEEMNLIETG